MTTDLTYLVWATALVLVQVVVTAVGASRQVGLPTLAGNRETMPVLTGWAGRASRAHRNMLENYPLFAALVLVAHISGRADATTGLGAAIWFWARVVYVPVYISGVPRLRPLVWFVSIVGLAMIFVRLV